MSKSPSQKRLGRRRRSKLLRKKPFRKLIASVAILEPAFIRVGKSMRQAGYRLKGYRLKG